MVFGLAIRSRLDILSTQEFPHRPDVTGDPGGRRESYAERFVDAPESCTSNTKSQASALLDLQPRRRFSTDRGFLLHFLLCTANSRTAKINSLLRNAGCSTLRSMKDAKSQILQIRITDAEKEGFELAAVLAGISLSSWVRERLRLNAIRELEGAGRRVPFIPEIPLEASNG